MSKNGKSLQQLGTDGFSRLTIPEFAPTEAHPRLRADFPLRIAAVGER